MAIDTSQFRNGLKIELDGEPFVMTYFQHVKPGKGGAFVRTKVKNLRTGRVLEKTFRSGEKVGEADVEEKKMQYLYQDGEQLIFMDTDSYDQIPLSSEQLGDARKYLKENLDVDVVFWRGKPINVSLPSFIEALVSQCDPGVKGDTASGATKPATLETEDPGRHAVGRLRRARWLRFPRRDPDARRGVCDARSCSPEAARAAPTRPAWCGISSRSCPVDSAIRSTSTSSAAPR
jgi:elongation factor P